MGRGAVRLEIFTLSNINMFMLTGNQVWSQEGLALYITQTKKKKLNGTNGVKVFMKSGMDHYSFDGMGKGGGGEGAGRA